MNVPEAAIGRATSEPSLEIAMQQGNQTRDVLTDCEHIMTSIEDYINGPRPEKEMGGQVEGCAAGALGQICQVNASNLDRLQTIQRRIAGLAQQLGVQR